MLEHPWAYGVDPNKQPYRQPVVDCTYWPVLGSFKHHSIYQFRISIEYFYEVHKVFLDGISENMASLL